MAHVIRKNAQSSALGSLNIRGTSELSQEDFQMAQKIRYRIRLVFRGRPLFPSFSRVYMPHNREGKGLYVLYEKKYDIGILKPELHR